jgi:putative oxidoreductase
MVIDPYIVAEAAVRLGLGTVFVYAGLDKLMHWTEALAELTDLKLPLPGAMAAATIFVQIVAGVMVVVGFGAGLGAILLAGFTALATLAGHRFWLLRGQPARKAFTTALEHLAIIAGLFQLALLRGLM